MKYLITAVAVAVALFVTNGTASAQHGGDHSGSHYTSPPAHNNHGSSFSNYWTGPSVRTYSGPLYNLGGGIYSNPGYYAPNTGIYSRAHIGNGHSMPHIDLGHGSHHRR